MYRCNDILIMKITVYHGSNLKIMRPQFGYGLKTNDFGQGFYCTPDIELAKEWACHNEEDGYANEYSLDLEGLKVLDLCNGNYNVLNWLYILLKNRIFDLKYEISKQAKSYIMTHFKIKYENYDVIIGYRVDDSYFTFTNRFLNNSLSLEQLSKAMYLGQLGEQIVLKTQKSFSSIKFIKAQYVSKNEYYSKYKQRDEKARNEFQKNHEAFSTKDKYVLNMLEEKWRNSDEFIQRIVRK